MIYISPDARNSLHALAYTERYVDVLHVDILPPDHCRPCCRPSRRSTPELCFIDYRHVIVIRRLPPAIVSLFFIIERSYRPSAPPAFRLISLALLLLDARYAVARQIYEREERVCAAVLRSEG